MTERGADFDAKREAYIQAVGVRDALILNPDKTMPVEVYRTRLGLAHRAVDRTHKAMLGAWG